MSIDSLMRDEIYIESPSGETVGPVKALVQGNKVYVKDEKVVIKEGGKIIRPLPNGKSESFSILHVDFTRGPHGDSLSHYKITVHKDTSLIPASSTPTISISHCQGIQVGNHNLQQVVASFEMLAKAIDSADVPEDEKNGAKEKLKAFLSHPLTVSLLGSAAVKVFEAL